MAGIGFGHDLIAKKGEGRFGIQHQIERQGFEVRSTRCHKVILGDCGFQGRFEIGLGRFVELRAFGQGERRVEGICRDFPGLCCHRGGEGQRKTEILEKCHGFQSSGQGFGR